MEAIVPLVPSITMVPMETMVPQVPMVWTIIITVENGDNPQEELMSFPAMENFPKAVHRAVKSRAAEKDISIKEFVIQSLRYALVNDHIIQKKAVVKSPLSG